MKRILYCDKMKGTLIIPEERFYLSHIEMESGNLKMWLDKSVNGLLNRIPEISQKLGFVKKGQKPSDTNGTVT